MNIVVMKFGGTSVANLSRIRSIAKIIKTRLTSGEKKILVVVSAMSGVTNKLAKEYNL